MLIWLAHSRACAVAREHLSSYPAFAPYRTPIWWCYFPSIAHHVLHALVYRRLSYAACTMRCTSWATGVYQLRVIGETFLSLTTKVFHQLRTRLRRCRTWQGAHACMWLLPCWVSWPVLFTMASSWSGQGSHVRPWFLLTTHASLKSILSRFENLWRRHQRVLRRHNEFYLNEIPIVSLVAKHRNLQAGFSSISDQHLQCISKLATFHLASVLMSFEPAHETTFWLAPRAKGLIVGSNYLINPT